MPRLLLATNPSASRVTAGLCQQLHSILSKCYEVTPLESVGSSHVRTAAAEAAAAGFDVVVAVGGDGVVNHVVNGIAGTETALGIIPAGTANVLAQSLGLPAQPCAAADFLVTNLWSRQAVPVARLVTSDCHGSTNRIAVSQIGMGLDAHVVTQVERNAKYKQRFGSAAHLPYLAQALCSQLYSKERSLQVRAANRQLTAAAMIVQVRCPYTYLGKRPLAFLPASDDGMDVLLIKQLRPRNVISALVRLVSGRTMGDIDGLQFWPGCRELDVESDPAIMSHSDGELLGEISALHAFWRSDELQVVAPQ